MANTEISGYEYKRAIPNKIIRDDGVVTDLMGNEITQSTEVYDSKVALPNKFLNPDGSYSTLQEIIAGSIDTNIFIIVTELPEVGEENKIYLVPKASGVGFVEWVYADGQWDTIGELDIDLSNYSTTDEMNNAIASALSDAELYADTNFLKKNNTTAYTPTANYHPATKKYVDDNAVTFKPFPNTFVTNSTTQAFLNSITTANLPAGMAYLGQVSLSDMPSGVTIQAEVEVYIYPQNVAYCVMRSAEVSPYVWEVNSYENRGWEATSKVATDYADTNFLKKNNTTSYTPSADYNPATKKYVDDSITNSVTNALNSSY